MRLKHRFAGLALAPMVAAMLLGPGQALASQSSKNSWRNIGVGAAALGVYGLTQGNKGLAAAGLAGAGYSAYRYEQDRKHQSQAQRARRYHSRHRHRHYAK